jgi:glycosyltransferase involved in cell wall biosynthesis
MKKIDKSQVRKMCGIPEDIFLFGMVAANKDNPPRKSFQHVMDAFAVFHKTHPKSGLYFHTITNQNGGFQIEEYAKFLGIDKAIYHAEPYEMLYLISAEDMAKVYSNFDCLLIPSQNEGFGVPIIEAGACEVPVIATDFTSMRDLVIDGETGYKVKVRERRFSPLGAYVAIPDIEDLLDKMEAIYDNPNREKMGKAGRKFVEENFDVDVVWEKHWKPFFAKLEKEIYPDA